jgi:hypothetical protein
MPAGRHRSIAGPPTWLSNVEVEEAVTASDDQKPDPAGATAGGGGWTTTVSFQLPQ